MGKLNLNDNLFIGTQELKTFQDNCLEFKVLLGYLTKTYGFVDLKDSINQSSDNNCWKVEASNGTFTITSPSYAFAYPYNLIAWNNHQRVIKVPESMKGTIFWVKIKYAVDSFEKGNLVVDSNGNVTGTNTIFTDKLRGEPNFASIIELFAYDSNSNTYISKGQFSVESVTSDKAMVISGNSGLPSTSIPYLYKVVGTFPIGTAITTTMKFPFIYDSCEVELVEEATENKAPNEGVMMVSNTEFYIARMQYTSEGVLTVLSDVKDYFENTDLFEPRYSKWWSLK